jgi:hypothetical protein
MFATVEGVAKQPRTGAGLADLQLEAATVGVPARYFEVCNFEGREAMDPAHVGTHSLNGDVARYVES